MKNSSCFKDFAKYSSLNVMGMIGLSCYILADTFFVSKGLGTNGLTALNLAIPFYSFIHGSGLMLGMGGATKYSILKGQKDTGGADRAFTHTAILSLVFALAFFACGLFFSDVITKMLGADKAVFQMCKTYLRVILLFAPMFVFNDILLCFVRNDGAPQLSMIAMLGGSFSNIILDYIFIFPFQMGIFGAVFATGLAPMISMVILSPYFFKKKNCFHFTKCPVSSHLITTIFSNGLPSLITEVSSGVVIIVFNFIILNLEGNTGVAAYGVIANLSLVVIAIYTGIAQGIQPIISKNYGVGNQVNINAIMRYAFATLLTLSAAIYLGIFLCAPQITSVFNSEHNPVLQEIAITGLKIYFTAVLFAGFNIILSVYFTSTDYAHPAHIISVLRGFLIMIPMAFLLSYTGGMTGVWCAFPLTELIVSAVGIVLLVLSQKKQKSRP